MKNAVLLLVFSFFAQTLFGEAGIFEGGVIVNGTTYYETGFTFNGRTFSVTEGGTLNMTYAYVKTFKNGGWDVCSARMNYSVYPASGSPSFTAVNLPFGSNLGNGDQQWNTNLSVNLASGLSPGTYKIRIYYDATVGASSGCGTPLARFLSNGGNDYIATLTVNAAMPVALTSFDAQKSQGGVLLQWSTASERDNNYFQVEHRSANTDWETLGKLYAKGNSTTPQSYSFLHRAPVEGDNYYRLRQTDFDGRFDYSPIAAVSYIAGPVVEISPNPLNGNTLNIKLTSTENAHQLRLYNLQGQLLQTVQINAGDHIEQTMNIDAVPSGMLLLQVDGGKVLKIVRE